MFAMPRAALTRDEINEFRDRGEEFVRIEANKFGETNYFLLNQADTPSVRWRWTRPKLSWMS